MFLNRHVGRRPHPWMLLAVTVVLVASASLVGGGPALALAQTDTEPTEQAPEATSSNDESDQSDDSVIEDESNVTALLIGGMLIAGGVWAYTNRDKRFPGQNVRT